MITEELERALESVARRIRHRRLWSSLGICWSLWVLAGAGFLYSGVLLQRNLLIGLAVAALLTGLGCVAWALRSERDPRRLARRIEAAYPELAAGLLTAVEESLPTASRPLSFLQESVIRSVVKHHRKVDWRVMISDRSIAWSKSAQATAAIIMTVVFAVLIGRDDSTAHRLGLWNDGPLKTVDVQVTPGDTEIERGGSLLVVGRFGGEIPADVSLVVEGPGTDSKRLAMSRSLDDPTFAARLDSVNNDLKYHLAFNGGKSPAYQAKVFEYPNLTRADAKLVFPSYTALESKSIEDVRHVTAIEGTELTLICRLNKEVASARLVDKDVAVLLKPSPDDPTIYLATMILADSHRFKLELLDREQRKNKHPIDLAVNVTKNRPPMIAMKAPGHDVRVSPIEELRLLAKIDDDYGVVRHGVTLTHSSSPPKDVVLTAAGPQAKAVTKQVQADHIIDFEALKATPDELLTYFVWAEDYGPDGKVRRTDGDMYFAEVRHFEEIFRQGEQPPESAANEQQEQEGAGNAQQAEQLAELQKQIINATWKLIRRETKETPTEPFVKDVELITESQKSAIEQAGTLGERLQDRASQASLKTAVDSMNEAVKQLGLASGGPSTAALKPALAAEQSAYQALLKLRAREFEVVKRNSRQRQQNSRASGASANQRQLNQLELKNEDDRFETQSQAQKEPTEKEKQQRETRQVVNRLRELAQRQADLNERLKELQSALEAAKTATEKEEVERQLKRLRDQQEQVLRDTDELRERMESEANRERMNDARQQVEQGRENVRQASEALNQGDLSQALNQGTRANRQLNDVREEMRKQSSAQFSEEMSEMRQQARELDQQQDALSQQLAENKTSEKPTLRDDSNELKVRQAIEEQKKGVDDLVERLRKTVQDAEEPEPLLAKSLYDAVRKAEQKAIPEALDESKKLVDLGAPEEAAKASRKAGEGIGELREGVERAAGSVLGDETEALRRAQSEINDLANQLDQEIAQAGGPTPNSPTSKPNRSQNADKARADDPKAGQPGQPGQDTPPGENEPQAGDQAPSNRNGNDPQRDPSPKPGRQPGGSQGQAQSGGSAENADADRLLNEVGSRVGGPGGPITGEGFRQWSDRMRDVEELLDDPELRADASRIRDRVRGEREEFKRHAKEPDWRKLRNLMAEPIRELQRKINQELRRRESPDALVPIDRDPVPPRYSEEVRRYYERLGSGQ